MNSLNPLHFLYSLDKKKAQPGYRLSLILIFLLLFGLVNCASTQLLALKDCRFRFVSLESQGLSSVSGLLTGEFKFIAKMEVENPNEVPVSIKEFNWELEVQEQTVASGGLTDNLKILPSDTSEFEIKAGISLRNLAESVKKSIQKLDADYTLRAKVALNTPYGVKSYKVSMKKGQWSFDL